MCNFGVFDAAKEPVREGGRFAANGVAHSHPADATAQLSRVVSCDMRRVGDSEPYKSGSAVARMVVGEFIESNPGPVTSLLPNMATLRRKANKVREGGRPAEPRSPDFDVDFLSTPGRFFRGGAKVSGGRRLLFAADKQLALLEAARTWYGDGAFLSGNRSNNRTSSTHLSPRGRVA